MDIFRIFENLSFPGLQSYIDNRQEENLYIDFKTVKSGSLESTDDKRNFSKALSGFANSSGGLIIWGIDARKNGDGTDCAAQLKPIEQVEMFVARLNQLTGEGVDPIVHGVRHRIVHKDTNGIGFAASLVPESDEGPHMAKLGEFRYYKRSGDSFYKMEHFDVADMFARRRRPLLVVTVRVASWGAHPEIVIGLRNDGRATAKSPYLAIRCDWPFCRNEYGVDGNRNEGMPFLRVATSDYTWAYAGGMDIAIHPGMSRDVMKLSQQSGQREAAAKDLTIHYALACDDQVLQESSVTVTKDKMALCSPA